MKLPDRFADGYWSDRVGGSGRPLRPIDRLMAYVAMVSAVIVVIYSIFLFLTGTSFVSVIQWLTVPFMACGALYHLRTRWWFLIPAAVVPLVLFFVGMPFAVVYAALLILFGAPGISVLSCTLQRATFFGTVKRAESVNLKKKPTASERSVRFMFDVPPADMRDISIRRPARRGMWKDAAFTAAEGMLLCPVLWICALMIPAFADGISSADVSGIMALAQSVPVIALPFAIYKTMDAGMDMGTGRYSMHRGLRSTAAKMSAPLILATAAMLAVSGSTMGYLMSLLVMTAAVAAAMFAVSLCYHWLMESQVSNDVMSKWKSYRPVTLLSPMGGEGDGNVPGTPKRE